MRVVGARGQGRRRSSTTAAPPTRAAGQAEARRHADRPRDDQDSRRRRGNSHTEHHRSTSDSSSTSSAASCKPTSAGSPAPKKHSPAKSAAPKTTAERAPRLNAAQSRGSAHRVVGASWLQAFSEHGEKARRVLLEPRRAPSMRTNIAPVWFQTSDLLWRESEDQCLCATPLLRVRVRRPRRRRAPLLPQCCSSAVKDASTTRRPCS